MTRRRSINAAVEWHQLLPMLGISANTGPMPIVVQCPLCNSPRLHIYQHSRSDGYWHHCPDCHAYGDMIELAAKAWKCKLSEAVSKLAAAGIQFEADQITDEGLEIYKVYVVGEQHRCHKLLADGRKAIFYGKCDVGYILQQMGLPKDHQRQYWPHRVGRFIGGGNRLKINLAFQPGAKKTAKPWGTIFTGPGWRDVLILPFQDMPKHYAGLLFVGRSAVPNEDYAFKAIGSPVHASDNKLDIGAFMYETMDSKTAAIREFGNTTFVLNDPAYALKLQARHMRDTELPLPIIATYNAVVKRQKHKWELRTYDLWTTRPDRKFTFWGAAPSVNLFNMAARAHGRVCIGAVPVRTFQQGALACLQWMKNEAKDWEHALEAQITALPEAEALRLLQGLDIAPELVQHFRAGCGTAVRQQLDTYKHNVQTLCTARVKGRSIVESPAGWFIHGGDECITNAVIRLDRITCGPNKDYQYHGRVLLGEQTVPFVAPMGKIERDAGAWIKREVLASAGQMVIIKQGWSRHLLDIARQFHEPEVIKEETRFGWRPDKSSFVFPRFSVAVGGNVLVTDIHAVAAQMPCGNLQAPEIPAGIEELTRDTPANQVFWATAACLACNIVAPAIGKPIAGIGLIGHGAVLVGHETARQFGCIALPTTAIHKLQTTIDSHAWPVLISARGSLGPWFASNVAHNAIFDSDDWSADVQAMLTPCRFVRYRTPVFPGDDIKAFGANVLPFWLKRMCERKLQPSLQEGPQTRRILFDFAEMLESLGCTVSIKAAEQLIEDTAEADPAERFINLIYRGIEHGTLRFGYTCCRKGTRPSIIRVADGKRPPGIFISQKAFCGLLHKRNVMAVDVSRITEILRNASVLDCECSYNDDDGWFIKEDWWNNQVERCRVLFSRKGNGGKNGREANDATLRVNTEAT